MPILKNARWELMAQGLAQGKTADAAYEFAGFKPHTGNASRLSGNESIQRRKAEILAPAVKRIEVTIDKITERLGNIALCNVTDGLKIEGNRVVLKDLNDLPREYTEAISSLKGTKDGIEVKFIDPLMALNMLGKHKGMFKENVNLTVELSLADLVNASYQGKAKAGTDKKD